MSEPPAAPLVLPRGLILLASLWLVTSWLLAMGVRAPVQASAASYTPGVRIMMVCVAVGMMVAWPLLRLSDPPSGHPIRVVLLDLVVLLALFQVVLWPIRLVTAWTPARTAAIDGTLAGWTGLAAAMVAATVGSARRGPRSLAMAACVAMCVGGPLIAWIGGLIGFEPGAVARVGPLLEVHALSGGKGAPPTPEQWRWIGLLAAANAAAWSGLLVARSGPGRGMLGSLGGTHT
jgi:hypothetical protein